MYKIVNKMTPGYLYDIIPPMVHRRTSYDVRNCQNVTPMSVERYRALAPFFHPLSDYGIRYQYIFEILKMCLTLSIN